MSQLHVSLLSPPSANIRILNEKKIMLQPCVSSSYDIRILNEKQETSNKTERKNPSLLSLAYFFYNVKNHDSKCYDAYYNMMKDRDAVVVNKHIGQNDKNHNHSDNDDDETLVHSYKKLNYKKITITTSQETTEIDDEGEDVSFSSSIDNSFDDDDSSTILSCTDYDYEDDMYEDDDTIIINQSSSSLLDSDDINEIGMLLGCIDDKELGPTTYFQEISNTFHAAFGYCSASKDTDTSLEENDEMNKELFIEEDYDPIGSSIKELQSLNMIAKICSDIKISQK